MSKSVTNLLLFVILSFALIGQGFANDAMTCDMTSSAAEESSMTGHSAHQMPMHDGQHHMNSEPSLDQAKMDCCGDECECPTTSCSTASYLVESDLAYIRFMQYRVSSVKVTPPITISSKRYRPPIII